MDIKNNTYWNNYYNSKDNNNKPSNFAKFIKKKYLKKKTTLLDVGAVDGRDSFYFLKHAKYIFAIDQSDVVINKNKLKTKRLSLKNILFKRLPSNKLKTLHNKKIDIIFFDKYIFDLIYIFCFQLFRIYQQFLYN